MSSIQAEGPSAHISPNPLTFPRFNDRNTQIPIALGQKKTYTCINRLIQFTHPNQTCLPPFLRATTNNSILSVRLSLN